MVFEKVLCSKIQFSKGVFETIYRLYKLQILGSLSIPTTLSGISIYIFFSTSLCRNSATTSIWCSSKFWCTTIANKQGITEKLTTGACVLLCSIRWNGRNPSATSWALCFPIACLEMDGISLILNTHLLVRWFVHSYLGTEVQVVFFWCASSSAPIAGSQIAEFSSREASLWHVLNLWCWQGLVWMLINHICFQSWTNGLSNNSRST